MSLPPLFKNENSTTTLFFPTRCPCCGERPGTEKWPVSFEFPTTYARNSAKRSYSTEVPICSNCLAEIEASSKRNDKTFIWTILPSWILSGIVLEFVVPPKNAGSLLLTFICLGGVAGVFLGAIVGSLVEWIITRSRPLADNLFVQFNKSGKLEFKNKEYQAEFDHLNGIL